MRAARGFCLGTAVRIFAIAAGVACLATLLAGTAHAGGPRWSTGSPFFYPNDGRPIVWSNPQLQYFTDPGDLSASVNHAAADALVAAAAAPWNIPISAIALAQGGFLAEHVSSANTYLSATGPIFPADVQAGSQAAIPIAILYDTDGSVTETLLGGGASDPGNCRQTAVTESVDGISASGQIQHAILILNGRCTGAAPALQTEMQYHLMRAFGRILGLGWSQLNDNNFTGTPAASSAEAQNWPVMHPIDVLCGPFAYQCMVQPFTLRTDDIASLVSLYPVILPGGSKTLTAANATHAYGNVSFSNGQGMQGVNVKVRRFHFGPGFTDATDIASSVSGFRSQQIGGNPITPKGAALQSSFGSTNQLEGFYSIGWIPIPTQDYWDGLLLSTEPINPLYTGQYAVGPYQVSQVIPSGPALAASQYVINSSNYAVLNMTATDGAGPCTASGDGTERAPTDLTASTGWWTGTLCGYNHAAWSSLPVQANRTLTIEVTALDEQAHPTTAKLLPVLGIWSSTDASGVPPTLAAQPAALNSMIIGMTNLPLATSTAETLRIALADQRGDGRPDFAYKARILCAATLAPASLPANGGRITITGMGFRPGNSVTVNGLPATVLTVTANTITAIAPPIAGVLLADVAVTDIFTGGQTAMLGALSYNGVTQSNQIALVSAPPDGSPVARDASAPFTIRLRFPDGTTPAPGILVTLSATNATLDGCAGGSSCVLTTDANGLVSTLVIPTAAGSVTLQATAGALTLSTTFLAASIAPDILHVLALPSGTVYATQAASSPFSVQVLLPDGVTTGPAGTPVSLLAVNATFAACPTTGPCTLLTDANGIISTPVIPTAPGTVSLQASAAGGMVSASFPALAPAADILRIVSAPGNGAYVGRVTATPFTVQLVLGDGATPVPGTVITLSATFASLGCGGIHCTLTTDATGSVTTTVMPSTLGAATVSASAAGQTVSVTFTTGTVPPDTVRILSAPADGSLVATPATIPFAAQVHFGDTGLPAVGLGVRLSAAGATLNACGSNSCFLLADALGNVTTSVTPLASGTVTLTASVQFASVSTTFQAVAVQPDVLHVISHPANNSFTGQLAAIPFAVQVMLPGGILPAVGTPVTLTATGATLGACAASSCVILSGTAGSVSSTVTPTAPGTVVLMAAAAASSISASFSATNPPPIGTLTLFRSVEYIAPGATVSWTQQATLSMQAQPAPNVPVSWTASTPGLAFATATSTSNALGIAFIAATVGPLATNGNASAQACAWSTVCATFTAVAVAAPAWRLAILSGAAQSVSRTGPFAPVSVRVVDTAGHWIGGVPVAVHQAIRALVVCPSSGRCPSAPILGESNTTLISDADGLLSVSPLAIAAGTPGSTDIVLAAGPSGYASLTLNRVP